MGAAFKLTTGDLLADATPLLEEEGDTVARQIADGGPLPRAEILSDLRDQADAESAGPHGCVPGGGRGCDCVLGTRQAGDRSPATARAFQAGGAGSRGG